MKDNKSNNAETTDTRRRRSRRLVSEAKSQQLANIEPITVANAMSAIAAASARGRKRKFSSIASSAHRLLHGELVLAFHAMSIRRNADPLNQIASSLQRRHRKRESLRVIWPGG